MTDTDRELLELAAKAACIDAQWDCPERGMMVLTPNGADTMTWNPLSDDGDALRLASKLGMYIRQDSAHAFATYLDVTATERLCNDACAATRRAIVRAAAEIGRAR